MKTEKNTGELGRLYDELALQLKKEQTGDSWQGRLSSSALAVAVAAAAMYVHDRKSYSPAIRRALRWLSSHRNTDGGYGDTPQSPSNVSTSLLCLGALRLCAGTMKIGAGVLCDLSGYLAAQGIDLTHNNIEKSVLSFYGKDRTFSVPILAMLAICGVLDDFSRVPQLPFELALLPRGLFRFFNLQVVSYALPALIAVGIVSCEKKGSSRDFLRKIRRALYSHALKRLESLMPQSGGFLEAIPLTAFVVMSLASVGAAPDLCVRGAAFLDASQRADGSFPIDTSLSSWVTTLAVKAYGSSLSSYYSEERCGRMRGKILSLQYSHSHPFNGAAPGGWGWNESPGAVPDADDTAGAILALCRLYDGDDKTGRAMLRGCDWLVRLQNRDGGVPTFCRGWGRLPFDSSAPDLTGHAIAAVSQCVRVLGEAVSPRKKHEYRSFINRALGFLNRTQRGDGSWLPLWFGSQLRSDHGNPVYGTARVAAYLSAALSCGDIDVAQRDRIAALRKGALAFIELQQNADGGWGAAAGLPSTQEESALALGALAGHNEKKCQRCALWLMRDLRAHGPKPAAIGLYFASLWYDERLYPLVYALEGLGLYLQNRQNESQHSRIS